MLTQSEKDWIKSEFRGVHAKLDYNKVLAERVRSLEKSKWRFGGLIVGISSTFSAITTAIVIYLSYKS